MAVDDYWAKQVDHVQAVVMGVGRIPIWSMTAGKADLPAQGGNWAIDFLVPECPPIGGRFAVSCQLMAENGQPIATHQTQHAFHVDAGHKVGILRVDYGVSATQSVVA